METLTETLALPSAWLLLLVVTKISFARDIFIVEGFIVITVSSLDNSSESYVSSWSFSYADHPPQLVKVLMFGQSTAVKSTRGNKNMRDTLRAHKSTAYSKVRYSPSPLYTLANAKMDWLVVTA